MTTKIYLSVIRVLLILAATHFIVIGTLAYIQHWDFADTLLSVGFVLILIILFDIVLIQKAFRSKFTHFVIMKIYLSVIRVLLILAAISFIVLGTLAYIQHWDIAGIMLNIGFALISIILFDIALIQKAFRSKN